MSKKATLFGNGNGETNNKSLSKTIRNMKQHFDYWHSLLVLLESQDIVGVYRQKSMLPKH